jgi:hypothetical protein
MQGLVVAAWPQSDAAIVYSDELVARFRRFEDELAAGGGEEAKDQAGVAEVQTAHRPAQALTRMITTCNW